MHDLARLVVAVITALNLVDFGDVGEVFQQLVVAVTQLGAEQAGNEKQYVAEETADAFQGRGALHDGRGRRRHAALLYHMRQFMGEQLTAHRGLG